MPEHSRGFPGTERAKKDSHNNDNSEHGAGRPEHLHEVATNGNASAVLAGSIFRFDEISVPEADRYSKERGYLQRIREGNRR